jgi:hypothetical protein
MGESATVSSRWKPGVRFLLVQGPAPGAVSRYANCLPLKYTQARKPPIRFALLWSRWYNGRHPTMRPGTCTGRESNAMSRKVWIIIGAGLALVCLCAAAIAGVLLAENIPAVSRLLSRNQSAATPMPTLRPTFTPLVVIASLTPKASPVQTGTTPTAAQSYAIAGRHRGPTDHSTDCHAGERLPEPYFGIANTDTPTINAHSRAQLDRF